MTKPGKKWCEKVESHFGFLTDFGFTSLDVDDSSFWETWVQYSSPTSAVRISKSTEFARSQVQLIRLVNGEVPAFPIWITDARIDWTLLDIVVEVRKPELMADVARLRGLSTAQLDEQLGFWARALKEVAVDFLDGDFAPIDEAGALMRSRVAENPEQVQVWIPGGAPNDSEARVVAEVQATVPPSVGVSVRRYWRGRRSKRG